MTASAGEATARWTGRAIVALVAAALVAALVHVITHRGPWYDEFFTYYVTSRPEAFGTALTRHWMADNHPPLFYALANLTRWLGESMEARRGLNVLIAMTAGGFAMAMARAGSVPFRFLAAVFFIGLAAQPTVLLYGAELRSYFLSMMAIAVMVLALVQLYWDPARSPARPTVIALWLSALVAFNTHIATTIIAGAVLGAFIMVALLRNRRDIVRAVLPPAVLAGLVFAGVTALQLPHWEANTRAFWIEPGFLAARRAIELAILRTLEANIVLLAGGGIGVTLAAVRYFRSGSGPAFECMVALGLAAAGAMAMMLAIHHFRPFVIERYLIALVPMIVMGLALGIAALIGDRAGWARPAALLAVALPGLLTLPSSARETVASASWSGTAALIGAEVRGCPATLVHWDPIWNAEVAALPPAENRAVLPFAYAMMARRHGFAVEPLESRRVARGCPTLVWAEHNHEPPTGPALLTRLQASGFALSQVTIRKVGNGWVAYAGPPAR